MESKKPKKPNKPSKNLGAKISKVLTLGVVESELSAKSIVASGLIGEQGDHYQLR